MVDKEQIKASFSKLYDDIIDYKTSNNIDGELMYSLDDFNFVDKIYVNLFESTGYNLNAHEIINYKEDFDKLVSDYNEWIKKGKVVYFYLTDKNEEKKIKKLIPTCNVVIQDIDNGFMLDKYIVIADSDIEEVNKVNTKYKNNFHIGKKIKDYNQLEKGD